MKILKKISQYACAGSVGLLLSATMVYAQDSGNLELQSAEARTVAETERIQQIQADAEIKATDSRAKIESLILKIGDEQRQKMAGKINEQLARLNGVWTDHFTSVLNNLDLALEKIQTRADKAKANGHDTSTVNIAIQSAKTSISVARSAVATEAANSYLIDAAAIAVGIKNLSITTPKDQVQLMKNFKSQFRLTRDRLQKNIATLRDGVMKDARNSVKSALEILAQIPGVDNAPGR
jgi:hypothetical protein